jgi:hypothetical protein
MSEHSDAFYRHQSIYPTGSVRADFEGPERGPITVVITDLRAATPLGGGIEVHRGRNSTRAITKPTRPRGPQSRRWSVARSRS